MIRKTLLLVASLACLASTGCSSYRTAVVSTQGHAYVVSGGLFGMHMLYCDATGGKPVCKEVNEQ